MNEKTDYEKRLCKSVATAQACDKDCPIENTFVCEECLILIARTVERVVLEGPTVKAMLEEIKALKKERDDFRGNPLDKPFYAPSIPEPHNHQWIRTGSSAGTKDTVYGPAYCSICGLVLSGGLSMPDAGML